MSGTDLLGQAQLYVRDGSVGTDTAVCQGRICWDRHSCMSGTDLLGQAQLYVRDGSVGTGTAVCPGRICWDRHSCMSGTDLLGQTQLYVRDGSVETFAHASTLGQELQIKRETSPSHGILTEGTQGRQASARVATRIARFK